MGVIHNGVDCKLLLKLSIYSEAAEFHEQDVEVKLGRARASRTDIKVSGDIPGNFILKCLCVLCAPCARAFTIMQLSIQCNSLSTQHLVFDIDPANIRKSCGPLFGTNFGPLNHLCASITHQTITNSMGPPHTRHVQFIVVALVQRQSTYRQLGKRTYSRSLPVTLGKHRMGTINATKAHADAPIGKLALPRFHGPGRNLLPTKNTLMKTGRAKATKPAIAPIENRAPTARSPPKMSRVMRIPIVALNQTALTGVLVCRLTCLMVPERGPKQSSLAYAKVTREAATYKTP